MILEYENDANSHYFYVMAWKGDDKKSAPVRKKRFDIYDDAVEFFNQAVDDLSPNVFVQMYEINSDKRVVIADSEQGLVETIK